MQKERKRLCLGSQGILARAIIVSVSLEALAGTTGLVAQSALGAAGFFGGSTLVVVGADVGVAVGRGFGPIVVVKRPSSSSLEVPVGAEDVVAIARGVGRGVGTYE